MSNNTGGPAFPLNLKEKWYEGMSLRDYFAAKAMQGLLSSDVEASIEQFAAKSYEMADAMLKAREA